MAVGVTVNLTFFFSFFFLIALASSRDFFLLLLMRIDTKKIFANLRYSFFLTPRLYDDFRYPETVTVLELGTFCFPKK